MRQGKQQQESAHRVSSPTGEEDYPAKTDQAWQMERDSDSIEKTPNDLTIIIASSPIPSHPSIRLIAKVLNSLNCISDLKKETKILIAQDGCANENVKPSYEKYLRKLNKHLRRSHLNATVVLNPKHGHLTGNLRNAMQFVETKYVLMLQHDLPFVSEFGICSVIEDMERYPAMKHVRFNFRRNTKAKWDAQSEVFGLQLQSKNYRYTRTGAWSDQNHLSTVDYYKTIVLREVPDGTFMEYVLNKRSHDDPEKYGTYIFGELDHPAMIKRINGRNARRFAVQDKAIEFGDFCGRVFRRLGRIVQPVKFWA